MDESQHVCGNCDHPKRGHALPRSEGGHGGGTDGHCVAFGCHCSHFMPSNTYKEQEYVGVEVPSWVREDAKVKVKASPENRKYGIRVSGGHVYAGEVGNIARQDGIGWWDWNVIFSQGRKMRLDAEMLEQLKPMKRSKGDA